MDQEQLRNQLRDCIKDILDSTARHPQMAHLNRVYLPSREAVVEIVHRLRQLVFPGYFAEPGLGTDQMPERTAHLIEQVAHVLYEQVRFCLRYREQIPEDHRAEHECSHCNEQAGDLVLQFFNRLVEVRELIASDVQAAFDRDPAAHSTDETIFCYPGLLAITVQRLAHEFYKLEIPLLPRMMTEYAHSLTGIDIHPGAQLGRGFFIDHGTGVVIGETTIIGSNVKIYQGVTLGALAPAYGQMLKGQKRHPTIEDDVTIYAGATILGGDTIVGRGCTIGGNVFITTSIPPQHIVNAEPPHLKFRDRRPKGSRGGDSAADFQI